MGCGASKPGSSPYVVAEAPRRIEVRSVGEAVTPEGGQRPSPLSPCGRTREEARQRLWELEGGAGERPREENKIPDKVWAAEVLKLRYELKQQQQQTQWQALALETAKEHIAILTRKLDEAGVADDAEAARGNSGSWRRTFKEYVRHVQADLSEAKAEEIGSAAPNEERAGRGQQRVLAVASPENERQRAIVEEQRKRHHHQVQEELQKAEQLFDFGFQDPRQLVGYDANGEEAAAIGVAEVQGRTQAQSEGAVATTYIS